MKNVEAAPFVPFSPYIHSLSCHVDHVRFVCQYRAHPLTSASYSDMGDDSLPPTGESALREYLTAV